MTHPVVIESHDFKFAKNQLRPILMKLRMMLEVDETFTFKDIRGQGQGQEITSVPYQDYFSSSALKTHLPLPYT